MHRPFIPSNKPRFWIVFVLACLTGLGFGLLGFLAAWLELKLIYQVSITLFFVSWTVAATSWLGFAVGLISGRYRNIEHRRWKEQVW